MKRTRRILLPAAMLALLLVCFFLPSSAFAASGRSNDNHTDTEDYCLRAHDVTVGLSEFSSKSRSELENDIASAASFEFLIRDTASGTGSFEPVSSGYSIDFSNLVGAPTDSGYVVTVTLPAITLSESSHIRFRVFVEDDSPQQRNVDYLFTSASAEPTLPEIVLTLLPPKAVLLSGETVTPSADFPALRDGLGEWRFSGWTPTSITLSDSDVTFTGLWVWTPLPTHTVTYEFVSGTKGKSLPNGVLNKLPESTKCVDGDTVTAPKTFRAFHMEEGTWRFYGWKNASQTNLGNDLTFVGEWRWHRNRNVTPAPSPTPTPTPVLTPTASPSATPNPKEGQPAPSAAQSAVPAQAPSDQQPPSVGGTTGGSAKMVIATVLAALVATQAFAIASDLKVLKWYDAKKAARRAGA